MSCGGGCGGKGGKSPRKSPGSPTHRPVQLAVERSPRPVLPEAFGNNYEYASYGNLRGNAPGRVTCAGPYGFPNQFDTFGSQIDYNLSWVPKDVNLADILDQTSGSTPSARVRRIEPNITNAPTSQLPTQNETQQFLLQQSVLADKSHGNVDEERKESLMEWFDRSVEEELKKHKDTGSPATSYSPKQDMPEIELEYSKATFERIAGASASQIEMAFDLRKEPDTALSDAVDKLAKAEAMCKYAGAVKAAEAAAQIAPPELAEEAAASGARGYVTDIQTTQIHEELHGVKPIEVVGYIGVTKPKNPIKKK